MAKKMTDDEINSFIKSKQVSAQNYKAPTVITGGKSSPSTTIKQAVKTTSTSKNKTQNTTVVPTVTMKDFQTLANKNYEDKLSVFNKASERYDKKRVEELNKRGLNQKMGSKIDINYVRNNPQTSYGQGLKPYVEAQPEIAKETQNEFNTKRTAQNNYRYAKYLKDYADVENEDVNLYDQTLGNFVRGVGDVFSTITDENKYFDENGNAIYLPTYNELKQAKVRESYGEGFGGDAMRFGADAAHELGKIGTTQLLNSVVPFSGTALYFSDIYADQYKQNINEGYTDSQAMTDALLKSGQNYIKQRLIGGLGGKLTGSANPSWLEDTLTKSWGKLVSNPTAQQMLASMTAEGVDEFTDTFIEAGIDATVLGKEINGEELLKEAFYSGGIGAVTGAAGGIDIRPNQNLNVTPNIDTNIDTNQNIDTNEQVEEKPIETPKIETKIETKTETKPKTKKQTKTAQIETKPTINRIAQIQQKQSELKQKNANKEIVDNKIKKQAEAFNLKQETKPKVDTKVDTKQEIKEQPKKEVKQKLEVRPTQKEMTWAEERKVDEIRKFRDAGMYASISKEQFIKNNFSDKTAKELGITKEQVGEWFDNAKTEEYKKLSKKMDELYKNEQVEKYIPLEERGDLVFEAYNKNQTYDQMEQNLIKAINNRAGKEVVTTEEVKKPKGKAMSLQELQNKLGVKEKTETKEQKIADNAKALNLEKEKKVEKSDKKVYNVVGNEKGDGNNEFRRLQEESRNLSKEQHESLYKGDKSGIKRVRENISRVLQPKMESIISSNNDNGKSIRNGYVETKGKDFHDIFELNHPYLKNPDTVSVYEAKDYKNNKNYLSEDGLSGFSITPDGDLISVFNNSGKPGMLLRISDLVKENAKTLDCFQNNQQKLADMYEDAFGFKTASIMGFNYDILAEEHGKEYADAFVEKYGEAPVHFMVKTNQEIETKHFNKDQYDEALDYRNSFVDKEGTSDSSFSNAQKTKTKNDNVAETKQDDVLTVEITGEKGKKYFMDNGVDEKVAKILSEKPKAEKTNIKDELENTLGETYRLLVSRGGEVEKIAKVTNNPSVKYKYDKSMRARSEAQQHIGSGQADINYKLYDNFTDKDGNKVNMSLNDIREDAKANNISEQDLNEYLAHWLNTDRYLEGKPVFGDAVTDEDSMQTIEKLEKKHPEINRIAQNVWQYEHNELKNRYDSGLISKKLYDKLKKYEHYVRIQRNVEKVNSDKPLLDRNGKLKVNQTIQEAKGGNQDILPIMEGIADYTMQTTQAIRMNESVRELANAISVGSDNNTISLDGDEESFGTNPEFVKSNDDGTYTMTYFKDGNAHEVPINKALYDAYVKNKAISAMENNKVFKKVTYLPKKLSSMFRGVTTNYNPMFMVTNAFKDIGDAPFNSKYTGEFAKVYASTEALREVAGNGVYNQLYNRAGGQDDSYFTEGEFKDKSQSKFGKVTEKLLTPITKGNEIVESTPRMAEFIATIKANGYEVNKNGDLVVKNETKAKGKTSTQVLDEALYNAAEVTTNFKRGGDLAKSINRNGGTFFNASIQGFDKQVRNFKDAFTTGDKRAIVKLLAKAAIFGIAPTMLNDAAYGDDDEYEELQEYIKDNYYLFKADDGTWIRIPKGRAMSILGSAYRRTKNYAKGDKDAFNGFAEFASGQVAPNNPFDNNIIAPFFAVANNKSWSGNKIISQSMEKKPTDEQYNEKTDEFSKWLGKALKDAPIPDNFKSPMGINYLIDQYSGGAGDVFLPMLTPKATGKSSNPLVQPFVSKFTADSVYSNKSVGTFYDTKTEIEKKKNSVNATKMDKAKYSYLNSQNMLLSELYKEQSKIQSDPTLSNEEKYEKAREIQKKINELAKKSVKDLDNIENKTYYIIIGDNIYYLKDNGDGTQSYVKDSYADSHKKSAEKKGMALYDYYKEKYEKSKNK